MLKRLYASFGKPSGAHPASTKNNMAVSVKEWKEIEKASKAGAFFDIYHHNHLSALLKKARPDDGRESR